MNPEVTKLIKFNDISSTLIYCCQQNFIAGTYKHLRNKNGCTGKINCEKRLVQLNIYNVDKKGNDNHDFSQDETLEYLICN